MPRNCHLSLAGIAVAFAGLVSAAHAVEPQHGEFATESLQVGHATRVYRLVVPNSVDLKEPAPLVIAFHGMLMDTKDLMPHYTKLNETADKHAFIVAYPGAVDRSWGLKPEKVRSDLAFFDALVAKLSNEYKIDPDRIYVLGMSNGGYFAHVVGKERSKEVAAVASHSGPLGMHATPAINAERKFPVLIIHGDQDKIFPVQMARDTRDQYQKEGHEVKYVELPGVGHLWGAKYNVNETIWQFFAEHPLKK